MTAFDLQFIIPGIVSILLGLFLLFWSGMDSMYSSKENSAKNIKFQRIFWGICCIIFGLFTILGRIFDWPVIGYIIPPPH